MPRTTKQERAALQNRARETAQQDESLEYPYDAPAETHMTRVKRTTDTLGTQKHVRRSLALLCEKRVK